MKKGVVILLVCIAASTTAYEFQNVRTYSGSFCSEGCGYGISGFIGDLHGYTFMTGTFTGAVIFGSQELSAATPSMFLVKRDPKGDVEWVSRSEGGVVTPMDIVVSPDQSVYVTGTFRGQAVFGDQLLNGATNGWLSGFVVKISSAGAIQWARSLPECSAIALAPDGLAIWLTGRTLFVRGYDHHGNLLNEFRPTSLSSVSTGTALAIDSGGNFYVAGYFNTSLEFGITNLTGRSVAHFTAKLAPDGKPVWAMTVGQLTNAERSFASALRIDMEGSIITLGEIDKVWGPGSAYPGYLVLKHSPSGELLWTRIVGEHRTITRAHGIALDSSGGIYVIGKHVQSYYKAEAQSGAFLTAYTANGTPAAKLFTSGPLGFVSARYAGVAVDRKNAIHLVGELSGNLTIGETTLNSSGWMAFSVDVSPLMSPRLDIAHSASGVRIRWPAAAVGFRLQESDQPEGAAWGSLSNHISAGIYMEHSPASGDSEKFYRLQAAP